jgi:undecaprenyl-diphosphatase
MTDIIKTIILGILEGLTEFIPVSSTGHLIILNEIINFQGEFAKTFDIFIQLGAILSVIIIYKNNFIEYIKLKPNFKIFPNIFHIIVTTIPALAFGYLLHPYIKKYLFSSFTVAIGLIIGSFIMLFADYYNKSIEKDKKMTYGKAFIIGLFQCLAMWPGVSRSGATISGAVLTGTSYKNASTYSFICAVPIMIVAISYDLFKTNITFTTDKIIILATGFIVSFIVGYFSILFFLKLINKIKLMPFAIYRIILAVIILSSPLATKKSTQEKVASENNTNIKNIEKY